MVHLPNRQQIGRSCAAAQDVHFSLERKIGRSDAKRECWLNESEFKALTVGCAAAQKWQLTFYILTLQYL
jgi:hypothetical protein